MIAKGKIRADGAQLARYLMTGEKGEIARLVETRGLDAFAADPPTALDRMEQWAGENTRCRLPFFHGHIRLAPGESLTDRQWMESLDRMEKRLGFEGQPRMVSFHIDAASGEKHLHVGWFRIDLEAERAIDPGMYKNHLKEFCRREERRHALREISSERQPDDRATVAGRNEVEEARRLGTDVRAVRGAILDCLEQADGGRAFKAALEERGFALANGDRRDCFVVIDQEGGHHALNKRLTGLTLATLRERLSDLDRSQLPGVEQAQEMQRARTGREEHGRGAETAEPIHDRDAADREWQEKVVEAAIAAEAARSPQETRPEAGREGERPGREAEAPASAPRTREEPVAPVAPAAPVPGTATIEARELDEATNAALGKGAGALGRFGMAVGKVFEAVADFFAPTAPKSPDQAVRDAGAAEHQAEARAEAGSEKDRQELLAELRRRSRAEAERDTRFTATVASSLAAYERPRPRPAERDADHERDRERER